MNFQLTSLLSCSLIRLRLSWKAVICWGLSWKLVVLFRLPFNVSRVISITGWLAFEDWLASCMSIRQSKDTSFSA